MADHYDASGLPASCEQVNEALATMRRLLEEATALAATCSCGTSPMTYDGPQADCAVHGAIRAFNDAQREIADLRAAVARAEQATAEARRALQAIVDEIPVIDGLPDIEMVMKGVEYLHRVASEALAADAPAAATETRWEWGLQYPTGPTTFMITLNEHTVRKLAADDSQATVVRRAITTGRWEPAPAAADEVTP